MWWLLPDPIKPLSKIAQLNKHNHRNTKSRRDFVTLMEAK